MHRFTGPIPKLTDAYREPKRRYLQDGTQQARCPRCQAPLIATVRGWRCGCS